jgi:choline dehydrogenase-like flavoprotein
MALGKPTHDWAFSTAPQPAASDRVVGTNRGKMLGGSSGLNFLGWDRASRAEYDAWKTVSQEESASESDAWDWDGLLPYFKKSETTASSMENPDLWVGFSKDEDVFKAGSPMEDVFGYEGPIKVYSLLLL